MFTEKPDITTAQVKRLLLDVYRRYRNRRIDKERAREESSLLVGLLQAVAEEEQSKRLEDLKNVLRS
jgi:hypothetical protein